MRTEMDVLILNNYLLLKEDQPEWPESKGHLETYDPDAVSVIADGPTMEALRKIFTEDFLPVARQSENGARQRISFRSEPATTNWIIHSDDQSPEKIFDIPLILSTVSDDPHAMAEAMIDYCP